ncbi:unnamed protein product [Soboliphyme baturini]|uniref:ZP domain-containing protein n=1 Tax=Soboliphyme baturini TaxID=241478 RepID=A0A183IW90_9BILA|nr:unnamed protein product [Soboliphyme baturini]
MLVEPTLLRVDIITQAQAYVLFRFRYNQSGGENHGIIQAENMKPPWRTSKIPCTTAQFTIPMDDCKVNV